VPEDILDERRGQSLSDKFIIYLKQFLLFFGENNWQMSTLKRKISSLMIVSCLCLLYISIKARGGFRKVVETSMFKSAWFVFAVKVLFDYDL